MAKTKVDVGNFMGVINATRNTEAGIEFSGEHMPSGNPVTSPGVTTAVLKDRGMAEQWHASIKGQYEREKSEINHERSKADTPELVIREQDGHAEGRASGEPPVEVHHQDAEEELQAGSRSIQEELEARRDSLRVSYEKLAAEYFALEKELNKVETALAALNDL